LALAALILKSEQVTICPFKENKQIEKKEEVNEINNQDLEAVIAKAKLTALNLLNEAKSKAEKLLDDAEKEAEKMLAKAIQMIGSCNALLQQDIGEKYSFEETIKLLNDLFS
jgi:flagellar biosynthesis/type III secretory pathway ATPase